MKVGDPVFVLTRHHNLMPASLIDIGGTSNQWMYKVINAHGAEYTCSLDIVFSFASGMGMLRDMVGRQLAADGYQVAPIQSASFRVYQADKHGLYGGYEVKTRNGRLRCTCAADKAYGYCKHAMGVHELVNRRARLMRSRKCFDRASRLTNLASALRATPAGAGLWKPAVTAPKRSR